MTITKAELRDLAQRTNLDAKGHSPAIDQRLEGLSEAADDLVVAMDDEGLDTLWSEGGQSPSISKKT